MTQQLVRFAPRQSLCAPARRPGGRALFCPGGRRAGRAAARRVPDARGHRRARWRRPRHRARHARHRADDDRRRPRRSGLHAHPGHRRLPPAGASRRAARDAEDRGLAALRRPERLRDGALLEHGSGRIVANEMRRDSFALFQNDNFAVLFDTFHDRRNGVQFQSNPLGGLSDSLITDERDSNRDWNTVWDARARRFDQGWIVEMAIPFRSLRYPAPGPQDWGVQFRRVARGENEFSYLTPMPAAFTQRAMVRVSQAATLVGLEAPKAALNLEVKPYALGGGGHRSRRPPRPTRTIRRPPPASTPSTRSGTASWPTRTINTDFAQVEDDEQQVNLTRFSLFFPERRDFFLEGAGIFAFGGASVSQRGGQQGPPSNTPILFYSRTIGLFEYGEDETAAVPLLAGGRLTGRTGAYTVGALNIQQRADASVGAPSTNFSVRAPQARHPEAEQRGRDLHEPIAGGERGRFEPDPRRGRLVHVPPQPDHQHVRRAHADRGDGTATTPATAATCSGWATATASRPNTSSWSGTSTRKSGSCAARTSGATSACFRFSPRPPGPSPVRKYQFETSFDHFTDTNGRLETQVAMAQVGDGPAERRRVAPRVQEQLRVPGRALRDRRGPVPAGRRVPVQRRRGAVHDWAAAQGERQPVGRRRPVLRRDAHGSRLPGPDRGDQPARRRARDRLQLGRPGRRARSSRSS